MMKFKWTKSKVGFKLHLIDSNGKKTRVGDFSSKKLGESHVKRLIRSSANFT